MNTPVNCTDSELSTFLQGLAEGYLPTYYSDTSPSAPSRLNLIASKSYTHGKKTVSFLGFPSLTMLKHSMESRGGDLSKSSPEVSRAKTYPAREKGPESAEKEADYGQKWQEWFAKLDPVTSLWKTRQCSLFGDLDESLETWPRWGMMRNGACLELAMPVHLTKGTESGYLPTPRATDGDKGTRTAEGAAKEWARGKNKDLGMVAVLWPTPRAGNPGSRPNGKGGKILAEEVAIAEGIRERGKAIWKTPQRDDAKNSGNNEVRREGLSRQVRLTEGPSGKLNPQWVEWLMGWKIGWTDLNPLETGKCHNAPRSHGEHSAKE